ncbi:MAG TPA: ACP S-malonyltransferase [Actinomycetota bacterium]|nr:ACP S-malonyltransferase [Actinomycetota bacterium]
MLGWVFPGQGSQFVGMGAGLASGVARETFDIANDVVGRDIRSACLNGPVAVLGATEICQPAILTVSVAAARSLEAVGLFPDVVAGHSVGEFAALVAARAISFEDALRAISARADAMAAAGRETPGAMAAILGLDREAVEAACRATGRTVGVAAINGPSQIVISGERGAVDLAAESARNHGARRVIPLDVSVAAHSLLMEPAKVGLREALDEVSIRAPRVPFVSCVVGRVVDDPIEIADLLCEALTCPVRWVETTRAMWDSTADRFYEVGPGKVLTGLMRGILPEAEIAPVGHDDAIAELSGSFVGGR